MNTLLRNQAGKELRRHWPLLIAWCALMLWEFLHGAGTTSRVFDDHGGPLRNKDFGSLFQLAWLVTGAAIAVAMGFSDSPVNSSGFIHTRPISSPTVWGAKALVLGLCVALPLALVPFGVTLTHGAGYASALAAAADRLAFGAPVLAFFLCWGGLLGSPGRLAAWTAAAAGIIFASFLLAIGLQSLLPGDRPELLLAAPGAVAGRLLQILWLAAGAAVLALTRQLRGPRMTRPALTVSGFTAAATALLFSLPGWNPLRPDTRPPRVMETALAAVSARPDPYTIEVWRSPSGTQDGAEEISLQARFEFAHTPPGVTFHPRPLRASLTDGAGFETRYDAPAGENLYRGALRTSEHTLLVLRKALERDDLTIHDPKNPSELRRSSPPVSVRWGLDERLEPRLRQPVDLLIDLEVACMRVRPVATLPFIDGASATVDGLDLTLMLPPPPLEDRTWFSIRTRAPRRLLTRDRQSHLQNDWNLRYRYLCVLVHRERKEALLCHPFTANTSRGAFSGLPEMVFTHDYGPGVFEEKFDSAFFREAELRVFRLDWIGNHRVMSRVAGLRLDRRMVHTREPGASTLSFQGYRRALGNLGPVPEASRPEDVLAVLRLIDAAEQWRFDEAEPAYLRLLRFGRQDLGLLLSSLGRSDGRSQSLLRQAIGRVASEADKDRILAVLEDHPQLAELVIARGWERDAREPLLAILQARRPLPHSALRAIAFLDEPETFPYLAEQFAHHGHTSTFELLTRIPALRPELNRIVAQRWEESRRLTTTTALSGNEMELALRIGDSRALDLALRAITKNESSSIHRDLQLLRPAMLLPQDYRRVREYLRGLTAEDFVFDEQQGLFLPRNPIRKEKDPS